MTTDLMNVNEWRGATVVDRNGDKIGKLDEVYLDEETGRPEWALVHTGLFGTRASFVPISGASTRGDALTVPWEKDHVKGAPNIEPEEHLTPDEEAMLYKHYGLSWSPPTSDAGYDTSGPTTDDAMTRSEEELRVGKAAQERGRVRLRKYVVTEHVQQTVPVQKEVARVEREPITEGNIDQALDGPAISDEEHEMILSEEEPVVEKRVVPKERVRLEKDVVTEEQQVSEEIRKERIETDGELDR